MPAKLDGEWVFMNPEIISRDDGPFMEIEGCMSFGFREHKKVPRYKVVAVKFSTSTMDDCIAELHGLPAEIFQHEIDHGKGISIYDR
jgi:peptide deformylase